MYHSDTLTLKAGLRGLDPPNLPPIHTMSPFLLILSSPSRHYCRGACVMACSTVAISSTWGFEIYEAAAAYESRTGLSLLVIEWVALKKRREATNKQQTPLPFPADTNYTRRDEKRKKRRGARDSDF